MSTTESTIRKRFKTLAPFMDERVRRLWAGTEAEAVGRGGIAALQRATGLSRTTVRAGRDELRERRPDDVVAVRRPGGGRPRLEKTQPELAATLESLVEPVTRGDPESPLRWTTKSTRTLSEDLEKRGFRASPQKVGELLHELRYSLQSTRKTIEGNQHPDRNAQFEFINARVEASQRKGQPVISVDTKKKELVGAFKNGGKEWQPKGEPVKVRVHDFIDEKLGKAIPYGVYDVTADAAWVNVGIDHDTAEFAVESIWQWWRRMGRKAYPHARELLITADGGGSNASSSRLWKVELQKLADRTGLHIGVSHFPPGTSKWNKIEHRLFCHITENWRGRPLVDLETIVQLIGCTRTKKGLRVKAGLDSRAYPTGIVVEDKQIHGLRVRRDVFHGEWNYTFRPTESA
jgi:hypothetical protein